MLAAVQMFALGIIGDALAGQRAIQQRVYERVRRLELEAGVAALQLRAWRPRGRQLTVETIETSVAAVSVDHRAYRDRRERLRQVRDLEPARSPADGRLHALARRAGRADGATEAHEVGCGEGELAIRLARRGIRVRGTDAFPQVLEEARSRAMSAGVEIDFEATPVEELDPARHGAELIVCCEVLEHLDDPERALEVLAAWPGPG